MPSLWQSAFQRIKIWPVSMTNSEIRTASSRTQRVYDRQRTGRGYLALRNGFTRHLWSSRRSTVSCRLLVVSPISTFADPTWFLPRSPGSCLHQATTFKALDRIATCVTDVFGGKVAADGRLVRKKIHQSLDVPARSRNG